MHASDFFQSVDQTSTEPIDEPFSIFIPEEWEKIVSCTEIVTFCKDDEIIAYQDTDCSLYILVNGSCNVLIPDNSGVNFQNIATIEAGNVFGEVSFFDGKPRSAIIKAANDGTMLRLSLDAFQQLSLLEPKLANAFLFALAKTLATRLRRSTGIISYYIGK